MCVCACVCVNLIEIPYYSPWQVMRSCLRLSLSSRVWTYLSIPSRERSISSFFTRACVRVCVCVHMCVLICLKYLTIVHGRSCAAP